VGSRFGFYTLIAIIGLLSSIGFGAIRPGAQPSSPWQIAVSAAQVDNGGDNDLIADNGDNEDDNDFDDNDDNNGENDDDDNFDNEDNDEDNDEDNAETVIVIVTPTSVPTTAPAPAPPPPPPPAPAPPPPPVAQGPCQFVLGFLFLHQQLQGIDGNCTSNEQPNPDNGDSLQTTENGLMVYQASTNTMRWTNGYETYTYSACGLQRRLNTQTFVWETDPAIAAQTVPAPGTCAIA
jgi:hypothetical protein